MPFDSPAVGLWPISMEPMGGAVVGGAIAGPDEFADTVAELREFLSDPRNVVSHPRYFQVSAWRRA
jgi:hypothetical protein